MSNTSTTTTLTKEKLPAPKSIKIVAGPDDHAAVERQEVNREEAARAVPFKWRDQELAPFAIDREADWLAYRSALNQPALHVVLANPQSFLADAIAIVWFCSVSPDVWLSLNPVEVNLAIRRWTASNVSSGEQNLIIDLGLDIFNRAHATQVVIKPSSATPGK